MIELTSTDWYTVTGRGQMVAIDIRKIKHGDVISTGDVVLIDGKQWEVRRIEKAMTLMDPPSLKGLSLNVREVLTIEGYIEQAIHQALRIQDKQGMCTELEAKTLAELFGNKVRRLVLGEKIPETTL
jgi:hypothetical protein